MQRSDLPELHFITPIVSIPSIMRRGILCKNDSKPLKPNSVAMEAIQDIRDKKSVPGGLALHDYANLYVCARNPMLLKVSGRHAEICVLRVSTKVLDLASVVIADGNAASRYTAFRPSPSGLAMVDRELVFAEYWTDQDQIQEWKKKSAKCAEVLVPRMVDARFVVGAYVSCHDAEQTLIEANFEPPITIDPHLFFTR